MSNLMDCMYNWFAKAVGVITQVFINLESTASVHYSLAEPWVASGDFEIEFDFATSVPAGSIEAGAMGQAGVTENFIQIQNSANNVAVKLAGTASVAVAKTDHLDGNLHTFKLLRVGTNLKIFIDEVILSSTTIVVAPVSIGLLGALSVGGVPSQFFDGIISNVKLTDLTTPSNSLEFKLNELTKEYELPVSNVYGSELWTNPPTSIGTWTSNGGGSYSHTGASSEMSINGFITAGASYQIDITIAATAGLIVQVQLGGAVVDSTPVVSLKAGTHSIVMRANSTVTYDRIRIRSAADVTVSNISIKQVTNFLTYENIALTQDVRDTYTLVDGVWLGSSVWANPPTRVTGSWVDNGGGSYTKTSAIAGDLGMYFTTDEVLPNTTYLMDFTLSNSVDTLNIFTRDAGANLALVTGLTDGTYSLPVESGDEGGLWFARTSYTGSIDNVSLKRLIEVGL